MRVLAIGPDHHHDPVPYFASIIEMAFLQFRRLCRANDDRPFHRFRIDTHRKAAGKLPQRLAAVYLCRSDR
jgi:hypothetical protein